jgi:hypothetical protein
LSTGAADEVRGSDALTAAGADAEEPATDEGASCLPDGSEEPVGWAAAETGGAAWVGGAAMGMAMPSDAIIAAAGRFEASGCFSSLAGAGWTSSVSRTGAADLAVGAAAAVWAYPASSLGKSAPTASAAAVGGAAETLMSCVAVTFTVSRLPGPSCE